MRILPTYSKICVLRQESNRRSLLQGNKPFDIILSPGCKVRQRCRFFSLLNKAHRLSSVALSREYYYSVSYPQRKLGKFKRMNIFYPSTFILLKTFQSGYFVFVIDVRFYLLNRVNYIYWSADYRNNYNYKHFSPAYFEPAPSFVERISVGMFVLYSRPWITIFSQKNTTATSSLYSDHILMALYNVNLCLKPI